MNVPEANVLIFSLLLNLPWEFWQTPFFRGMTAVSHGQGVWVCTQAALGDALISLVAFWIVSAITKTRRWVARPAAKEVALFTAVGLVLATLAEVVATRYLGRWAYSTAMPILPVLRIGLLPLLQWLLLPPIILWFVRRQVR